MVDGQADHRSQHQRRSEGGVEEELDRGVDPALASPDPDDEVHRDQHRLEEDEEQEEVEGEESPDHPRFEEQGEDHELLGSFRDRGGSAECDRDQERGEHQHRQRDPVDPQVPVDPPRLVPDDPLHVLEPRRRLESPVQIPGESQWGDREHYREREMHLTSSSRHQRHDDRRHRRQQDHRRQHETAPGAHPASGLR